MFTVQHWRNLGMRWIGTRFSKSIKNADDTTIKKQYRKLALHLHPDKNKLPGSESAFKTVGEAHGVLLDKEKRRLHDMRRKPIRKPAPAPAPAPSFQHQQAPNTAYYTQPVFKPNVNTTRNSFTTGLYANRTQPSFQTNVNAEKQPENSARVSPRKEGSRAKSSGTAPKGLDPHSIPSEELAASLGSMVQLLNLVVHNLAAPALHSSAFLGSCSRIWQRDSYWDARPSTRSNDYPLFIPRQNCCSTSVENSWTDKNSSNFGVSKIKIAAFDKTGN